MSYAGDRSPGGWHPVPEDDAALLRSELDACAAEIVRLRAQLAESVPRSALKEVGRIGRRLPWLHRPWRRRVCEVLGCRRVYTVAGE